MLDFYSLFFFNSLLARVDCFSIPVFLVFRVLRWRAFHNSRIKGCFPNKPWNVICIPYTMYYQASTALELQNIKDSFIIKVRLCAWAHSEDSTFWMVRSETSLHHSILFSHNFSFLEYCSQNVPKALFVVKLKYSFKIKINIIIKQWLLYLA